MYESTIHSKYKGKFEISLYGENSTDPSKNLSTWRFAYFSFNFNRNSVIADGSLDTYKITVPDGCSINGIYTSISSGGVRTGNTITYNNSPYSADVNNTNTVVMMCNVDKIVNSKNEIAVSAKVEETIGDKTFTYMDSDFKPIPLMEYYKTHPLSVQKIEWKWTETEKYLIIPSSVDIKNLRNYLPTNLTPLASSNFPRTNNEGYLMFRDKDGINTKLASTYNIFYTVWLKNIIINSTDGTDAYANEISNYVKNAYLDEASLEDSAIQLPGLKATKYPTTDGYMWKYEIQENFVGYARTATVDFTKHNYMYFSTSDANTLDEAFKKYLELYPYQGVDKEELIDLVDTKGISNILKLANANGDIYINEKHLFHYDPSDNRLELIKDNVIRVPFSDEATMKTTFESELSRIYSEKLSTTAMGKIVASEDVINSLVKNSTSNSNKESYNEYFIVQDGSKYLLVNVYSNGIECTYVTVSTLDAKLENDTLSFNMSDKNQINLLSTVNALDKHFIDNEKLHSRLSDDEYLVVTTSDGITNVVYSIPNPNEQTRVTYDDKTTEPQMKNMFIQDLSTRYGDILSNDTIKYILDFQNIEDLDYDVNPGLYMLLPVLADNNGNRYYEKGETIYNLYFVVQGKGDIDNGKYLLFNVYSGGYDNVYATVSVLASKEENGTISFTLEDNNSVRLNNKIDGIDAYFGRRLSTTTNGNTKTVTYPITSTTSIQDSKKIEEIKEVSASLKTSQFNEEYLEVVSEVKDINTIDVKSNSKINDEEEENKKYSNTQEAETNKTTEETEETSNDGSYVPSSDASNVDAGPSSDGGTNLTSSITNEVVEVNSSPTSGIPLVETG